MYRTILQVISWIALFLTVLPACLYLAGSIELGTTKTMMLAASVVWFVVTPFWMGRESGAGAKDRKSA